MPSSASTTSTSVVFAVPVAVSPARAVLPDDAAVEASLDAFTAVSRASSPSTTSSNPRPTPPDSPVRAPAHATTTTTRARSARRTRRARVDARPRRLSPRRASIDGAIDASRGAEARSVCPLSREFFEFCFVTRRASECRSNRAAVGRTESRRRSVLGRGACIAP